MTVGAGVGHYGSPATVSATVTSGGAPAGGTVSFAVTGTDVSVTGTLGADGSVAASLPATVPVGKHTVVATYAGNATALGTTATATLRVKRAVTKVRVARTHPGGSRAKRTVRVTVPGTDLTAAGTVVVRVDGRRVATRTLSATGRATISLPGLSAGTHTLRVRFRGSKTLKASTKAATIRVRG